MARNELPGVILGNPQLHMARMSAVDDVKAEAEVNVLAIIREGAEGGRTDLEGDCGGTQHQRHRHGAGGPWYAQSVANVLACA